MRASFESDKEGPAMTLYALFIALFVRAHTGEKEIDKTKIVEEVKE
jgi:hypothetical protein